MPKATRTKAVKRNIKHWFKCSVRERRRIIHCYLIHGSYYRVSKILGLDTRMVRYWINKFQNPLFHNKQLGGDKRSMFLSLKRKDS